MQTITASDIKQNSMRLQEALRDDLLITKRNKPFVVVMDYEKYKLVEKYINKVANDETFRAISNLENDTDVLTYNSKEQLFNDLEL